MLLDDEQVDAALETLRRDLDGGDPRSSFRIFQKHGELIAIPLQEASTDVMIWDTHLGWGWETDDGRYQPVGDEDSRYAHWCKLVGDFVRKLGGIEIEFDQSDREVFNQDISSWYHAKQLVKELQ